MTHSDGKVRLTKAGVRLHQWIDTQSLEPLWGVQCRVRPREWAHVVEEKNGVLVPLLRSIRDEAMSEAMQLASRRAALAKET